MANMLPRLLVALVQISVTPYARSDGVNWGLPETATPLYFKFEEIASKLPAAPAEYPRNMQGIFWLDQQGCYGFSSVPSDVIQTNLCFSFGDTAFDVFDEKTRTIHVSVKGPAWQFSNVPESWGLWELGYGYKVSFNEDYTKAQWQIFANEASTSPGSSYNWTTIKQSPWFANWTMVKQTPDAEECKKEKSNKKENSKCATWIRESVLDVNGTHKRVQYPVYEIVAPNGSKVQPYFDAYVACATSQNVVRTQADGLSFVGEYEGNTLVPVLTTLVIFLGVAAVGGLVASKFIPFGGKSLPPEKDKPLVTPGAE